MVGGLGARRGMVRVVWWIGGWRIGERMVYVTVDGRTLSAHSSTSWVFMICSDSVIRRATNTWFLAMPARSVDLALSSPAPPHPMQWPA